MNAMAKEKPKESEVRMEQNKNNGHRNNDQQNDHRPDVIIDTEMIGRNMVWGMMPPPGWTLEQEKDGGIVQFFVRMKEIPTVTHQEKRISTRSVKTSDGKRKTMPVVYESAALKDARALFRTHMTRVLHILTWEKGVYTSPWRDTPVALGVVWLFPRPKNLRNRKKTKGADGSADSTWKVTKPDTDNLIKLLKDEMTHAGWWHDDAQVVIERSMKMYAPVKEDADGNLVEEVGVQITIAKLKPEEVLEMTLEPGGTISLSEEENVLEASWADGYAPERVVPGDGARGGASDDDGWWYDERTGTVGRPTVTDGPRTAMMQKDQRRAEDE